MLQIDLVTLFPGYFSEILGSSITGRAQEKGLVRYRLVNLREFAIDRHGTVDDAPYGGGSGMVIRPEPVFAAVEWCLKTADPPVERDTARVVLLSARGELLDQAKCRRYSLASQLVLICGHYKDVDERVALHLADEELRIGDYVLSGGEPAATVLVDAVARLVPGALGDFDSALEDSFSGDRLGAPQYTRPREFKGYRVPEVLTGGDHERIRRWREEQVENLTRLRRPEMLE